MLHKRLLRQIKRSLKTKDIEGELSQLLSLLESKKISPENPNLITGFTDLFRFVGLAYDQDKDLLEVANRSVRFSSEELFEASLNLKKYNSLIQSMLNSLSDGFIIFDLEARSTEIVSSQAKLYFGEETPTQSLFEILNLNDVLTEKYKNWFQFLVEEKLPFEEFCAYGPKEFKNKKDQYIRLSFAPIREEKTKKINSVVMIAKDVSEELKAKKEAEAAHDRAQMIIARYQDPQGFYGLIDQIEKCVGKLKGLTTLNKYEVISELHTLKASLGLFSINSIMEVVHGIETELKLDTDKNLSSSNLYKKLNLSYQEFKSKYGSELKLNKDKFLNTVNVSRTLLNNFEHRLQAQKGDSVLLREFQNIFKFREIKDIFEDLKLASQRQALRLGKNIRFNIDVKEEIYLDPEPVQEFFALFVHSINNAIDHGIEAPEEREALGKKNIGEVTFQALREENKLQVSISDDGRGIDLDFIRAQLENNGLCCEKLSDEAVLESIFNKNFSLKSEASLISGRGLGLSALKNYMQEIDGEISVKTQVGRGTRFSFSFDLEATQKPELKVA